MSVDTKTLRKVYGLMGNGIMSKSITSCCDEIDALTAERDALRAELETMRGLCQTLEVNLSGQNDTVEEMHGEVMRLREALKHLAFAASMKRFYEIEGREDFADAYPDQADWENGDVDEELCQAISEAEAALEPKS